jgi:S1-C subfamily serine protease
MRAGDVIVAVDGLPLRSMSDLVAEVRRRAPGMTVTFDVLRREGIGQVERVVIEAVLGERPRS